MRINRLYAYIYFTHTQGTLDVGADADLTMFDDDLNVKACYVYGEKVYDTKDDSHIHK